MGKDIRCVFGVDVDAVAGWLGSYGGEDSPSDIQRGMFAGEVGTPRLLKLFEQARVKTSWFVPGHSIETSLTRSGCRRRPATRSGRTGTRMRTRSP